MLCYTTIAHHEDSHFGLCEFQVAFSPILSFGLCGFQVAFSPIMKAVQVYPFVHFEELLSKWNTLQFENKIGIKFFTCLLQVVLQL